MDESEIVIGAVLFVWGHHQKVVADRDGETGREVRLERITGGKEQRPQPWTPARNVARAATPSLAYS